MENRMAMSTLSITTFEPGGQPEQAADTSRWGAELSASFDKGIEDLASAAGTLLRLLMFVLPFVLPGLLILRALKRRIKKRKEKERNKIPA